MTKPHATNTDMRWHDTPTRTDLSRAEVTRQHEAEVYHRRLAAARALLERAARALLGRDAKKVA